MVYDARTGKVGNIMIEFADRTGLTSTKNAPRRYLWTDAHAVCNFLSLYRRTREAGYKHLALGLIDQVHSVLGKHREDDSRSGWISGLSDQAGNERPTAGGLRIGKKLNERKPDDIFDERLEWDRDGQYFHYLTKWMHALCRAGAVSGDAKYCQWAIELAKVAHAGFTTDNPTGGNKRIYWKMSVDLSYPLVFASADHDCLDAFVTYTELARRANRLSDEFSVPDIDAEIAESATMLAGQNWHTTDPLGLGGLLFDAGRILQMSAEAHLVNAHIADVLLGTASESLDSLFAQSPFAQPAQSRLAFREFGLSIGLQATAIMNEIAMDDAALFSDNIRRDLNHIGKYVTQIAPIEKFWHAAENQRTGTWQDHLDINEVMLATSLLPDEFLKI